MKGKTVEAFVLSEEYSQVQKRLLVAFQENGMKDAYIQEVHNDGAVQSVKLYFWEFRRLQHILRHMGLPHGSISSHTLACCMLYDAQMAAQRYFRFQYPHYCKTCFGTGMSRGNGKGNGACDNCINRDLCPRCGKNVAFWSAEKNKWIDECPGCKWGWGIHEYDFEPVVFDECGCDEEIGAIMDDGLFDEAVTRGQIQVVWRGE